MNWSSDHVNSFATCVNTPVFYVTTETSSCVYNRYYPLIRFINLYWPSTDVEGQQRGRRQITVARSPLILNSKGEAVVAVTMIQGWGDWSWYVQKRKIQPKRNWRRGKKVEEMIPEIKKGGRNFRHAINFNRHIDISVAQTKLSLVIFTIQE